MIRKGAAVLLLFLSCGLSAQTPPEESYHKKAQVALKLGEQFLRENDPRAAREQFDLALSYDATLNEAFLDRAQAKTSLGDLPGANTDYSIYLERVPNEPEAIFARGVVRFQLGLYGQAREDFTALLDLPEGETNAVFYQIDASGKATDMFTTQSRMNHTIYNYLGLIEDRSGNAPRAIAYFDSALRLNPTEADYLVNRGLSYLTLGDSTKAAGDFAQALALDPNNSLARYNLGEMAGTRGDTTRAEDYFTSAIESNPRSSASFAERAYFRMNNGHLQGALEDYDAAIGLSEKDADLWMNRGLVKMKLNDRNGAYRDFTQAIALRPDFQKAWLSRGNVLTAMGRYADAIKDYSAALLYDNDYALAWFNRAIAYDYLHQEANACRDLQQAEALGMHPVDAMKKKFCGKSEP